MSLYFKTYWRTLKTFKLKFKSLKYKSTLWGFGLRTDLWRLPDSCIFWRSDKNTGVAQLNCQLYCQKWDAWWWWLWQNPKRRKTMRWKEVNPYEFMQWKHFPEVVSTAKSQPVSGLLLRGSRPSTWCLMSKPDMSDRAMLGKPFPHAVTLRSPAGQWEVKMPTVAFSPSRSTAPILPASTAVKTVF